MYIKLLLDSKIIIDYITQDNDKWIHKTIYKNYFNVVIYFLRIIYTNET